MGKERILVVDDEEDIRELVCYNLEKEGYLVAPVRTGEEALEYVTRLTPDLVILDLMLPGVDGLEVCRRLKMQGQTRTIPILMLTAKSEDTDIVAGLELGADDYITKPFSPKVLVAHIRAVLRRSRDSASRADATFLRIHNITIDVDRHEVSVDGVPAFLSATEFAILEYFARSPGWVFSRNRIIDAVKGKDYPVTERSVDVQILGLRKKLGAAGEYIETIRGVGYRIQAEP
ncbi:MAG TPA: response regulator transcription factor [Spirochaetia bacterium]|nr:response regulator transcription factor [Spirochaetia bacterium]